jgi:Ni/Fe-hydrogenase subunit HybB-like protein
MTALRKVLVVDDDPVIGKSFDRVLRWKGYAVITAENGEEALSKLAEEKYDVVYTDIRMPGMSGLEVAETIKAQRPWTPVVIITGYGSDAAEARAKAAGVASFLRKPLSPEMIEGSVRDVLAAPAARADPVIAAATAEAPPRGTTISKAMPLRGRLVTPTTAVLAALAIIGLYFMAERFIYGLGAVTNLNAGYPWGIWVDIDIFIGTALGCGGFSMAIIVYAFHGRYHALMRPAMLGGLLGYTLGGFAAFTDLGRYWQAYNVLLPWHWQPNSIMFEVALCLFAYTAVAWIEFLPVFLERFGWLSMKNLVERWMYVFVALGILLPLMHQSSFGTVLLALGTKLSPLWFTVWLPLLFVVSAILMGYSVVMFEVAVSSYAFNLPSEQALIAKLSKVVGWVAVAWLVVRWADLLDRDVLALAFAGNTKAAVFWIENALFLGAALVLVMPAGRASQPASFLAAVALLGGGVLYRLDALLIGQTPVGDWTYFPSFPEMMVTIGIISLEVLAYIVVVNIFPVLEAAWEDARPSNTAHRKRV